ncbi:hypothetical protein JL720_9633 [Aureococcus anophagefferens]|nr:hypothetical protein JL720_9633 [Aureococcus anophagefferens]
MDGRADWADCTSTDETFNADIGDWDTSKVTDMTRTFGYAATFNQDAGAWDTPKTHRRLGRVVGDAYVRDVLQQRAKSAFNANIKGDENIRTFGPAAAFNQPIGDWDVSKDIGDWDVSKNGNMNSMFKNASAFSQDIDAWDASQVSDMGDAFVDSGLQSCPDWAKFIYNAGGPCAWK